MKKVRCVMGRIMFAAGMLACVVAILYPLISNYLYYQRQDRIITEYTETVKQADKGALDVELEACYRYNQSIVQISTVITEVSFGRIPYRADYEVDAKEYEARLNLDGSGVMGYVIIPKIDVHLPISHYATEEVLESGVGHLPESSLPVGGESSHSVLTGHTGSTSKTIFTDLVQMEIGDHFFLNVLGDILVYQVDQIVTVLPYEVDELMIVEGKDYCTLVTCTPYGINSHRLLVRGIRVESTAETQKELLGEEEEAEIIEELAGDERSEVFSRFKLYYFRAIVLGCVLAGMILFGFQIMRILRRKRE